MRGARLCTPGYKAVQNNYALIAGGVNIEMGGIRGLTAIDTPGGHAGQQSLMLVWTPEGHDVGRVYRLDGPLLASTVETTLKELYDVYQVSHTD